MDLKLKEKFVLLSLNDEKGGIEKGLYYFGMGLSACVMLDLVIDGLIEIKGGKISVKSSSYPRNKVLWDVMKRIRKSKKERPLKYWVSSLNMQSSKYKKLIINDLVRQGILRKEAKRFLGIPYSVYPTLNPKPEKEFRDGLLKSIERIHELDAVDIALLSILEATKSMTVLVKDKQERKRISKELKELVKTDPFGKAINQAIMEINTVIMTTVVTSSAIH